MICVDYYSICKLEYPNLTRFYIKNHYTFQENALFS